MFGVKTIKLKPHVIRLRDEAKDLHDKFIKLKDFIENNPSFETLDAEMRLSMVRQKDHMSGYLDEIDFRLKKEIKSHLKDEEKHSYGESK